MHAARHYNMSERERLLRLHLPAITPMKASRFPICGHVGNGIPLRNHLRFQKILAGPEPKTIH